MSSGFLPPHGGYRSLLSYRKSEIVYDATVRFCERFLQKRDRTVDQMVQAARSGKQNIIEGSQVSGTSKELEIKLVGVAPASLEELLADYQDFLRVRGLKLWDKDSKEALYVRRLASSSASNASHSSLPSHSSLESYETYRAFVDTRPPEVVANILLCLIHQTNYLLDRQLKQLEKAFLASGGLREAMTRARLDRRARHTRPTV